MTVGEFSRLILDGVHFTHRASLDCGCQIFAGRRDEGDHLGEVTLEGRPCCAPHERIVTPALTRARLTTSEDPEAAAHLAAEALGAVADEVRPTRSEDAA